MTSLLVPKEHNPINADMNSTAPDLCRPDSFDLTKTVPPIYHAARFAALFDRFSVATACVHRDRELFSVLGDERKAPVHTHSESDPASDRDFLSVDRAQEHAKRHWVRMRH
jgi:hypothetical protein